MVSKNEMATNGQVAWIFRVVIVFVAFGGSGYASSYVSARRCETTTANRVARELGTRDVFVLPDDDSLLDNYPGTPAILERAGFRLRRCESSGDQFDCFPWAGVTHAEVVGPFIVDVKWGYVAAPLSGLGVRTRYLTMFGIVIPVFDRSSWVT
jgi:hypothetical protein